MYSEEHIKGRERVFDDILGVLAIVGAFCLLVEGFRWMA